MSSETLYIVPSLHHPCQQPRMHTGQPIIQLYFISSSARAASRAIGMFSTWSSNRDPEAHGRRGDETPSPTLAADTKLEASTSAFDIGCVSPRYERATHSLTTLVRLLHSFACTADSLCSASLCSLARSVYGLAHSLHSLPLVKSDIYEHVFTL